MRLGRFAVAAAVATAAALGAATPALASNVDVNAVRCTEELSWGFVCFDTTGDKVIVYDDKADGYRVIGVWGTDYGREGECHNTLGAGEVKVCDYDMREDGWITLTAILSKGANGWVDQGGIIDVPIGG